MQTTTGKEIDASTAFRSKSTKFTDKMMLQNPAPYRPLAGDRQYRLRANSIRDAMGNRNQETLEFEARTPLWDQFRQELPLAIPTFGNWKKENLGYAIDTEPYTTLQDSKPKRSFRISDSHGSEKAVSKSKHPRFPRNSKLLSKFCSNELPTAGSVGLEPLPTISKTERVMVAECHEPLLNTPVLVRQEPPLSTESTKHSQEAHEHGMDIAQLKRQFARIYMSQKSRYQRILYDRGINFKVSDEQFNAFMAKLRTHPLSRHC